jgi:parallel beta-helix repeat protein
MRSERRRIWIGLLFAVLFTVLAFVSGACAADTYTVCPGGGCNYTSIQAAIDAATAGDTIEVRDGIYTENVVVTVANLTLRSEHGSASTTVLAAVNTSDVFLVTANSVTITGFTVRNANDSANAACGIQLGSVHNCTVSGNNASGNHYGIWLHSSSTNNTLSGNTASNNLNGIYLEYSNNNNTLTGNIANANTNYGIYLRSSCNNNTLSDNIATNNTNGIFLSSSCNNNMLSGNTANANTNYGIYLRSSCNNNTLSGNTANANTNYGIYLRSSCNNNTLSGNIASNNTRGIYLRESNSATLTGNIANSNNNYGIYLSSSSNNTLTGNTASNNGFGIWLYNSSTNRIYNNYFDNTQNAYDNGLNIWNISKTTGTNFIGGSYLGGNYWSDYTGEDTDGDGLGNTLLPHNPDGNILNGGDWLPLVKAEEPIFDTGEGSYPSLSGTFTGTITPSRNLTVGTLYTYYCKGTGGHTKSIELYEDQTLIASGVWSGYAGDWHNITFTEVTLLKDHEYRYVIETGSYPQIIHAPSWNATGGVITCEEFGDVNGKRHEGWIPAIRLS